MLLTLGTLKLPDPAATDGLWRTNILHHQLPIAYSRATASRSSQNLSPPAQVGELKWTRSQILRPLARRPLSSELDDPIPSKHLDGLSWQSRQRGGHIGDQ